MIICNVRKGCIHSGGCGGAKPHRESDCEKCPMDDSAKCIPVHYEMQVQFATSTGLSWESIRPASHPSNRDPKPYQYNTFLEARNMLDGCYPMPLENNRKRVVFIDANGKMEVVE